MVRILYGDMIFDTAEYPCYFVTFQSIRDTRINDKSIVIRAYAEYVLRYV